MTKQIRSKHLNTTYVVRSDGAVLHSDGVLYHPSECKELKNMTPDNVKFTHNIKGLVGGYLVTNKGHIAHKVASVMPGW